MKQTIKHAKRQIRNLILLFMIIVILSTSIIHAEDNDREDSKEHDERWDISSDFNEKIGTRTKIDIEDNTIGTLGTNVREDSLGSNDDSDNEIEHSSNNENEREDDSSEIENESDDDFWSGNNQTWNNSNNNGNPNTNTAKYYTAIEVSTHNTNSDCWVIVFNGVYDITPLINTHPGGNVFSCGTNQTSLYKSQHGTSTSRIQRYFVGFAGTKPIMNNAALTVQTTNQKGSTTNNTTIVNNNNNDDTSKDVNVQISDNGKKITINSNNPSFIRKLLAWLKLM